MSPGWIRDPLMPLLRFSAVTDTLVVREVEDVLLRHVGQGVVTGRFHEQAVEPLLHFGAANLQD